MIIAATGHRPGKLAGYSAHARESLTQFAMAYLQRLGISCGISGMALGWDTAFAVACLRLGVPLISAVPFVGQSGQWPDESRRTYLRILDRAAQVMIVSHGPYASWMMQARNTWMIDHAQSVAALWDGSAGGTKNCIEYVERLDIPYSNAYPAWRNWTACQMTPSSLILPAVYV